MQNFRRSLRYLRPYRVRIGMSILCVVCIMVLWGGGLAMVLPGAKILISDEGLHNWAWRSLTEDRLGIQVVARNIRGEHHFDGRRINIAQVLDVVEAKTENPAHVAGVRDTEWIVGVADEAGRPRLLNAYELARRIGTADEGRKPRLAVYDPITRTGRVTGKVTLEKPGLGSRFLGALAARLPDDKFQLLLMLLAYGVLVTILRDIFRFAQEYLVQTSIYRGLMDLRCDNYNVVLHLPTTFFSEKGVSDSMSRFVQDTAQLARGQIALFGKTLAEPGKAIASITMALILSWRLTLLTMVIGPPAFILIRKFGKIMKRASRRALEGWANMLAVLEETLTGIRVVKAYTMEGSERKRFFQVNRALLKQQKRIAAIDAATSPTVEALGIIAAMGAIALAGYWVLNNHYGMDRDKFFALMACLMAMFDPVRKLAHVNTRFQQAEAAAKRVFDLQDQPQEKHVPNAPMLPRHGESLEFRSVSFRYPSAAVDALKDIRLSIRAGQKIAVVGPNGSGKTTLVSLLPRLLDPTEGSILLDGLDVSQYSIRSLRRQIGLVTQDTVLFHATIAENISYGLRRPKPQDVLTAAKKAFVDEFVRDLPDGYETMVGAHGATLSGGQKQRIAIARAILRDPAILIFDEAMSQIDSDSERRITQAMKEFAEGRTTLLIAHRFATVLSADMIVVMEAGRIIDSGTHEKLLDRCRLYHHLYKTQFMDSGG